MVTELPQCVVVMGFFHCRKPSEALAGNFFNVLDKDKCPMHLRVLHEHYRCAQFPSVGDVGAPAAAAVAVAALGSGISVSDVDVINAIAAIKDQVRDRPHSLTACLVDMHVLV